MKRDYSVHTDIVVCTMSIPIDLSGLKIKKIKYNFFLIFNLLKFMGIDIVQTTMSV